MGNSRLTAGVMTVLLGGMLAVDSAEAVHLSRNGIGQALVYPYYTVNAQQQTLVSVVNTGSVAKAVKVRFREGHNGRSVLEFNLFLSPYDVWTGNVFALSDIDVRSDGAAILTTDRSCTAPAFSEAGTVTPAGAPYVAFRDSVYLTPDDGGPYGIERTREGHFEIIAMADLTGATAAAVKHNATGVPANCAYARNQTGTEADFITPSSGLYGSGGVINVQNGTYFAYNADALENFTGRTLFANTAQVGTPDLGDVNDGTGALGLRATALVVTPSGATESTYPGPDARSRRIDAVSAVFMADSLHNEYQVSAALAANTDWVVTFPTKSHYVDPPMIGVGSPAIPPFFQIYDGSAAWPSPSCVSVDLRIFDREERTPAMTTLPLPPRPQNRICREIMVLSFISSSPPPPTSNVLKSHFIGYINSETFSAGWFRLNLNPSIEPHALLPATNGNIHHGLPVTGFNAISITNNNATLINGVSTLSNYSGTSAHRPTSRCTNGTASTCN